MPRQPRPFRIQAKNYFLTYPQCSISKEDALDQLITISTPVNKLFIRVARELHEDGQPHLHALLQFEGKFQCCNPRIFDLRRGPGQPDAHPNIQGAKSSSDVKSYIDKGGDYIDHGVFQVDARSARGGQQSANETYAAALNTGNSSQALDIIKEQAPKDFILQFHNISANLERIFAPPTPVWVSRYSTSSFKLPDDLEQWAGEFKEWCESERAARPERFISVCIEGESRTGKTQWARSLGSHNYLCGHLDFNVKCFSDNVDYNVIDDISPSYLKLKHWKELIGAQADWQSNCKYGKPRLIRGGVPSIVLCNPGEGSSFQDFLDKEENEALKNWTSCNMLFIKLEGPLF